MAVFDRDALVDLLMAQISSTDILVGDHVAPKEGGWSTGMPGSGVFVAYTVLFSGSVQFRASVMVPGEDDATASFDVKCYGATRSQADDLSMRVWSLLTQWKPTFGDYRVNHFRRLSIGSMQRLDSQDPKHWLVTDTWQAECVPI